MPNLPRTSGKAWMLLLQQILLLSLFTNSVQDLSIEANYERGPIRGNVQLHLQAQPGHYPDSSDDQGPHQGPHQGDQSGHGAGRR
jgi:hypothetical protein